MTRAPKTGPPANASGQWAHSDDQFSLAGIESEHVLARKTASQRFHQGRRRQAGPSGDDVDVAPGHDHVVA